MALFGNGNAGSNPDGQANGGGANKEAPALKTWRAKVACTYQGSYVAAGSTVQAADMKNPHFELAET
jgi:hypothetical protein